MAHIKSNIENFRKMIQDKKNTISFDKIRSDLFEFLATFSKNPKPNFQLFSSFIYMRFRANILNIKSVLF